jgi:hypothetical protein
MTLHNGIVANHTTMRWEAWARGRIVMTWSMDMPVDEQRRSRGQYWRQMLADAFPEHAAEAAALEAGNG